MSEIRTYSGVMTDPTAPREEDILIGDIAHALSMLCRANGHFKSFHSVGQHCLECAREAQARGLSKRIRLACLLHDASEAYLSDVTRPVKQALPAYLEIEAPLQELIWNKWLKMPLTQEERALVFQIDDALLYHEFYTMTGVRLTREVPILACSHDFSFIPFEECEAQYLACFHGLIT